MKMNSRYTLVLAVLFGYVLLQFVWWEILLVRQTGTIINEQQKLLELSSTNAASLQADIAALHRKKTTQTIMIVGEGTVFLLLLLFGVYKIKQAHEKETALNRQQNNFFLSITHELKTPIAATKLQLQTLQKQKLDAQTTGELIRSALAETERLNLLIDNVLLASRLDNGEISFKPEVCDVAEETQLIVNRYYKKELEKGEVLLQLEPEVKTSIDKNAFVSVITNLVGNAVKYTAPDRQVTISVGRQNDKAMLCVSDNGCGINDADKRRIFERFYRAGNEETRSSKGTGLGLYIVKYILQRHKATINVKNNAPRGSIFEVVFHAA